MWWQNLLLGLWNGITAWVILIAHVFGGWEHYPCLLYTSDAADERSSVDLGGRRIIKKKKSAESIGGRVSDKTSQQAHDNTK